MRVSGAAPVAGVLCVIVIGMGFWILRQSRLVGSGMIVAACGAIGLSVGVYFPAIGGRQWLALGSVIVLFAGLALLVAGVNQARRTAGPHAGPKGAP